MSKEAQRVATTCTGHIRVNESWQKITHKIYKDVDAIRTVASDWLPAPFLHKGRDMLYICAALHCNVFSLLSFCREVARMEHLFVYLCTRVPFCVMILHCFFPDCVIFHSLQNTSIEFLAKICLRLFRSKEYVDYYLLFSCDLGLLSWNLVFHIKKLL
jgi:hypothetical protein